MPRKIRIQYPGAMYHFMSRGDRRENIFLDDVDRQDFLKTLAQACQKTAWQVLFEHGIQQDNGRKTQTGTARKNAFAY